MSWTCLWLFSMIVPLFPQGSYQTLAMLAFPLPPCRSSVIVPGEEVHPHVGVPPNHAVGERALECAALFLWPGLTWHRPRYNQRALSPADLSMTCLYRNMKTWDHQQHLFPSILHVSLLPRRKW